jgi:16S rRNA (guanine527-N7)-methyltransferase
MRPSPNERPVRTTLGRDGFGRVFPVSRETLAKLAAYVELLSAWNRRINLVAPSTMGDLWRRHILDSAQLLPHIPRQARVLVDLGSGAGLPGLILALLGVPEVHLIESDQRKAAFLREAVRVTGANAVIHATRAEKSSKLMADVVTARALAPLAELLDIAEPFLQPHTICLYLKGRRVAEELTLARRGWKMQSRLLPSVSDPSGTLLYLEAVSRDLRPA